MLLIPKMNRVKSESDKLENSRKLGKWVEHYVIIHWIFAKIDMTSDVFGDMCIVKFVFLTRICENIRDFSSCMMFEIPI